MEIVKFLFLLSCMISAKCLAVDHYHKKVENVQINASNGCVYFTLDGVDEADPIVSGQPWFTVASDNGSKQEVFSLVMAAQLSKTNVKVSTTGNKVCGYAGVHYVRLTN